MLFIREEVLNYKISPKNLEIILNENLPWNTHITSICPHILPRINLLNLVANRIWGADTITDYLPAIYQANG